MVDKFKSNLKPKLYIDINDISYEINASRDFYYVDKYKINKSNEKKLIHSNKFKPPLQSQMTLKIFKNIILKKKNNIPTYAELYDVNKSLIRLFYNVYKNKISKKKITSFCPIT